MCAYMVHHVRIGRDDDLMTCQFIPVMLDDGVDVRDMLG